MEGKKGLPHLFNNGKPSEMSDKDFYELIKWLDKEDGLINTNNAKINEKLDGSSQFFGLDSEGFFWEKFGSDQRFYSEEEIPDYWAGYRELFSDMKEALDDYLFEMVSGGFTQYREVKVQIEVITSAGSHNENNYQINLVPYRKDAFKSKGCLSIIQILLDGENFPGEDTYKNEIKNILDKYDYTVYNGYSIDNFEIDLSKEAMEVLNEIENYPFDVESTKLNLYLAEPEDLFDLPTRKYNQSKLKQIFAKAKEEMATKILSDMKDSTGALTENGMFEGLAITLNNGITFKVNSPDFKAAFLKHHQDAVARKMNKVTESTLNEAKSSEIDISKYFDKDKELPSKGKLEANDATLNDILFQIRKDLSKPLKDLILSWKTKGGVINTCNALTGSEEVIESARVNDKKENTYFIWVPYEGNDSRCYATGIFFKDKKGTFATVNDGLSFPKDHEYFVISLRKHNEKNMTGDTAIQECLQGIAIDLAKECDVFSELIEKIKDKITKNGFDSIPISGGSLKVKDFNEDKLASYVGPAAKTGIAFIEEFSEIVGINTKVYHPDIDGPLKTILEIGKSKLNGLPKDCWNPTDILVTDYTSEELKKEFANCSSLSDMNSVMKNLIRDSRLGKCFIPLSLKLNTSDDRFSVVERINLEEEMTDYKVSSHYVNTTGVGNEIDIYAHINGKSYKFYMRCNGTSNPIIEGQHFDNERYFKNEKFVNDNSDDRNIVDKNDADIEAFRVDEKDNTSSFLGKSKSILFSVMSKKELNAKKKEINFDLSNRVNYHEGSLPWRLIEMADKIESMPNGYGARGKQTGHDSTKAKQVAELARDLAYLIVSMKWSTSEAIIYLLTCSMKENYGAFNSFAPLYKIS